MKCCAKIICPVFAAVGIVVGSLVVHSVSPDAMGNWWMLFYTLIGFAVGALIAGIVQCVFCKKKCAEAKCEDEEGKGSCGSEKGGCH